MLMKPRYCSCHINRNKSVSQFLVIVGNRIEQLWITKTVFCSILFFKDEKCVAEASNT